MCILQCLILYITLTWSNADNLNLESAPMFYANNLHSVHSLVNNNSRRSIEMFVALNFISKSFRRIVEQSINRTNYKSFMLLSLNNDSHNETFAVCRNNQIIINVSFYTIYQIICFLFGHI